MTPPASEPEQPRGATPPPSYLAPYLDAVDEHGATFEATLWNSRQWQRARFDVLQATVDFRGRRILDCGCGLADLAQYLTDAGVAYEAYAGVEAAPEMLSAAQRRGVARASFALADFVADPALFSRLGPFDTAVFCGSLNTLDEARALHALGRAWDALSAATSGTGRPAPDAARAPALVFNFLSDLADPRVVRVDDRGPAVRHSARRLLDWALARSPRVAFRSDYLPGGHDATIAVWKGG